MKYDEASIMDMLNKAAEMTEMEINKYHEAYGKVIKERDDRITKLTSALEFYATQWEPHITHGDRSSWATGFDTPNYKLCEDTGNIAREALKND